MKTAARMSAIATTGPETSSMALRAASLRRHALFDVVLDGFDDDDGVVHDEADGEHEAKERKRIDGEAEQREDDERADEGDRHGEQGNESGAPALQKDVDDEDDEGERFEQRVDDLFHARGDGASGIEADLIVEILRETLP